jgi:hypothetical protein
LRVSTGAGGDQDAEHAPATWQLSDPLACIGSTPAVRKARDPLATRIKPCLSRYYERPTVRAVDGTAVRIVEEDEKGDPLMPTTYRRSRANWLGRRLG